MNRSENCISVAYVCSGHQHSQTFHYFLTRSPTAGGYGKVIALLDHTAGQMRHTVDVMLRRCVDFSRCEEIVLPMHDATEIFSRRTETDVVIANIATTQLVKCLGVLPVKDLSVVVPLEGTMPSQRRVHCGPAPRHFYMPPASGHTADLEHRVSQWQEVRAMERELRIVQSEYERQCAEAHNNEKALKQEIERLERQSAWMVDSRVTPLRPPYPGEAAPRYITYPHVGPMSLAASNVQSPLRVSAGHHPREGVRTPYL